MRILLLFVFVLLLTSCSVSKKLERSAREDVLSADVLKTAHVGISVYEPATGKTWYDYQGANYFVPASNTKIPTCYAAMKYLGDSLVGLRYEYTNQTNDVTFVGTGDPTFLHPDFKIQPVLAFLKKSNNPSYLEDPWLTDFSPLGNGWSWNDYQESYAAERSEMPIYGNVVKFYMQGDTVSVSPSTFYNYSFEYLNKTLKKDAGAWFKIVRPFENNSFHALYPPSLYQSKTKFSSQLVPFKTILKPNPPHIDRTFIKLLEDTLRKSIGNLMPFHSRLVPKKIIHSQPTDSLLRPMMHRSDNFFAEQTLLMVSNELLGLMNDEKIIDTLLKTDFKDLPQKPRWVDGSGLSRYNLFSPQDFVFILNKMKNEFGMARVKNIFATGGEGTLSNYYVNDKNFIYAKTGTLSGVVAISGFLTTKKGKELIFSVQVNNHNGSATEVRRAVEKFVEGIRERY